MSSIGIMLGLVFLCGGIYFFHLGIDSEIAREKGEQGLSIGVAFFMFILGHLVLSTEMRNIK